MKAGEFRRWRRRVTRTAVALGVAALALGTLPGIARGAVYEVYTISGYEIWYAPTVGVFAGAGRGGDDQLSVWYTSIEHSQVISPTGTVTGGWARLYRLDGVQVAGMLSSSGTVRQINDGPGCTAETHVVNGYLHGVTRSDTVGPTGAGLFDATLVHHRAWIFGRCITYSASVEATISIIV